MPTDARTFLRWPDPQHLMKGLCGRRRVLWPWGRSRPTAALVLARAAGGTAEHTGPFPFLKARRAFQLYSLFVLQEKANVHFLTERFSFNKTESGVPALISKNLREIYVKTVNFLSKGVHNGKWKLSCLFAKTF